MDWSLITLGLLFLTLGAILYQDLRYRAIDVRIVVVVFVLCLIRNYLSTYVDIYDFLISVGFVAFLLISLIAYFSVKHKRFFNPVDSEIGTGDILFFLAITPLFYFKDYILFFTTSLIFSLALFFIFRSRLEKRAIPLAGFISLYLMIISSINFFSDTHFFNIG